MITRDSETLDDVSTTCLSFRCCERNVVVPLHYITLSRLRERKKKTPGGGLWRATKTSKETSPFPSPFLFLFLLSSPRRARSTRFSRIRWYSNRQYNTRGYANTRAPNVSRYVKRTRTTHSRSEFTGVVSLFHLYQPCITAAVFGQRKQHGK